MRTAKSYRDHYSITYLFFPLNLGVKLLVSAISSFLKSDLTTPCFFFQCSIVEFKRKEDMLAALKDIDGTDFRGKRLSLKEDSASSSSSRRRSRSRSRSPPKSSKRRSHSRSKSRSRSPPRRSRSPPAAKDSNGTKKEGSPAPAASAAADGAGAAADPKSPSAAGDDAKSK